MMGGGQNIDPTGVGMGAQPRPSGLTDVSGLGGMPAMAGMTPPPGATPGWQDRLGTAMQGIAKAQLGQQAAGGGLLSGAKAPLSMGPTPPPAMPVPQKQGRIPLPTPGAMPKPNFAQPEQPQLGSFAALLGGLR